MRLTFFIIAPKLEELQSCARTKIKGENVLFQNTTLVTSKKLKEAPNAWAFIKRDLLEKYLVYSDLPQSGFSECFINALAKNASFVPFTISQTRLDHWMSNRRDFKKIFLMPTLWSLLCQISQKETIFLPESFIWLCISSSVVKEWERKGDESESP